MSGLQNIYIAIVDDDESVCRSLGRLLRTAGFHPVSYLSAEAFLEDRKHPQFECAVLDIQLGGMSGIELKTRLNLAGSTMPVIFITAHDDPETATKAASAGCSDYFRKTDPGQKVLDGIHRAIAGGQAAPAESGDTPIKELGP